MLIYQYVTLFYSKINVKKIKNWIQLHGINSSYLMVVKVIRYPIIKTILILGITRHIIVKALRCLVTQYSPIIVTQ